MSRIIYLHGFASSPLSKKAQFFARHFAELGRVLTIPDLAAGDFEHLTISSQLSVIEDTCRGEPVLLMGSSMGGYLAALYASQHPEVERLVLMAPAFSFVRRWPLTFGVDRFNEWQRTGTLPVYHYGQGRECNLDFQMITDGRRHEDFPDFQQPALIFHGANDDVVPASLSETFAANHPNVELQVLDSDHELLDQLDRMWVATASFLMSPKS